MTKANDRGRRISAVTAGALVATFGLAACGANKSAGGNTTSSQSPQQAVQSAVTKLGSQSSLELAFSLPITQSQAEQLHSANSKGPTPAEAQALTTGQFFVTEATGHGEALDSPQAATDQLNSVDVGLSFGTNNTPLELRYVAQNLFLRVQVSQLLSDVGQPSSAAASRFTSGLNQISSYVPGLGDLAQGKWVEVSHASLQPLEGLLKQSQASGSSSLSQTQMRTLRNDVLSSIQANSAVSSLAPSNGRDGYSVTVNVSGMLSTLVPQIQSTLSSLPGLGAQASNAFSKAKNAIPAGKSAVIDVYTSGGKLTEADLDLNQFARQKMSFPVPVRLTISSPGAPTAPAGATNLDLSKLPTLLGGLLGSLGHSSSSTAPIGA
ncbi:MAG: hypothetical protein KGQ66_08265 [Acidobacteriota bacterium]|nr:hypothetical protein [Acidobacteriota bacterium]